MEFVVEHVSLGPMIVTDRSSSTRPVARGWQGLALPHQLSCFAPQLSQPQLLAVADENLYAPHCPSLPPSSKFLATGMSSTYI
jgi:hypothetical protein